MSKNNHRGFTVQVNKSYANKFIAPSKLAISGDTVDIALGFNLEPWQTMVLLPWEVEKLAEALNIYLEANWPGKDLCGV